MYSRYKIEIMNRVVYLFLLFSFLLSGFQAKSQTKDEHVIDSRNCEAKAIISEDGLADSYSNYSEIELPNKTYISSNDIPEILFGEETDKDQLKLKAADIKVNPSSGNAQGGCEAQDYSVEISGATFGNGWDISNVTICGVEVCQIIMQSPNSVVVYPGAGTPGNGDIVITSKSKGKTTIENAFTYLVSAPGKPANNIKFSKSGNTSGEISWTRGDGESCVVFMKESSVGSAEPADHTTYNANSFFGKGTQIESSGWYCVFNGNGSSVLVSGLSIGKEYDIRVAEYNGPSGYENYLIPDTKDNSTVQSTEHIVVGKDLDNSNSSLSLGKAISNMVEKSTGE